MIRVTTGDDMERVFSEQQLATMKGFGDALNFNTPGICSASISDNTHATGEFLCTRTTGHVGPHIAMGTRPVAIWESE